MSRRITRALVIVAVALMESPGDRFYGYDLSRRTGIRSGVLYPLLDRFLKDEWVVAYWELPDEVETKRPRRYYVLTEKGSRRLGAIAATAPPDGASIAWGAV